MNRACRASTLLLLWVSLPALWAQEELEPLNEDQLRKRIAVHLDHKRVEPALDAAEQWIRVAPRNPDAWAMCGRLRTQLGQLDAAEAALSRVLAMDPGRARAWADRGALRLRLERPAEALEDAGQAIAIDPGLALSHFVAGLAHAAQGRHDAAVTAYDRAIEASPPYPKARYARGQSRKALGQAEAAQADFAAALELDKQAARPWGTPPGRSDGHADLSHVVVGQRYHYAMQNNMESIWEVREVGEDTVVYEITMLMDMGDGPAPVGDPQRQEWRYEAPVGGGRNPAQLPAAAQTSRETVTVSGIAFDCLVVTSEAGGGVYKSWVTMSPGSEEVPTFPGVVKVLTDGNPNMVLTDVFTPKAPQRR